MPLILSVGHSQIVDIGDLGSIEVRFDTKRRRVQLFISGDALAPCRVRRQEHEVTVLAVPAAIVSSAKPAYKRDDDPSA